MLGVALSGTFIYAVTVSTLARLTIYISTCAALPVLRRRAGTSGGIVMPALVILLALWLMSNSTLREAGDTAIAAAIGFGVFAIWKFVPASESSRAA